MNKSIKASQGGFTLIELIVVIVILGILAATALPKFASLSGEARLASLNAAKGALAATSAMTHGKYLVSPVTPINVEGTSVAMNATSGYPAVVADTSATGSTAGNIALAAGLATTDYTVYTTGAATATRPVVAANQFAVVPVSIAGTAAAVNCYVLYTAPTAANTAPTITVGNGTTAVTPANCE
jgi:MSHA pilin protein MshA